VWIKDAYVLIKTASTMIIGWEHNILAINGFTFWRNKVETVKEHCKHPDCRYRCKFDGNPSCKYMIVTGKPRGCAISECDKYRDGRVKVANTMEGFKYEDDI